MMLYYKQLTNYVLDIVVLYLDGQAFIWFISVSYVQLINYKVVMRNSIFEHAT
jgi:hypothetical protein